MTLIGSEGTGLGSIDTAADIGNGGGGGGGGGTIKKITSVDGSVIVVDPTGPITDLSENGVYQLIDSYGVVDDAPAINAAIAALAARPHPGGDVEMPGGTHRLKSTVNLASGVTLRGAGTSCRLIIDDSSGNIGDGIKMSDTYGAGIRDLVISSVAQRTAGQAIHITGGDGTKLLSASYPLAANRTVIERVDMDSQFNGLLVDNNPPVSNWILFVNEGRWSNITGDGLSLNCNSAPGSPGFGASHFFSRLFMYNNPIFPVGNTNNNAFRMRGSGDFNVRECETYGFDHGLLMDPPANGFLTTGRFQNCFFDVSYDSTVEVAADPAAVFFDIAFEGCWFASSAAGHGLYLSTANSGDVRVGNSSFVGNNIFGLVIAGGCRGAQINNSKFYGNAAGAVIATQSPTDFQITTCQFRQRVYNTPAVQALCVQIDAGCDRFIIADNNMYDSVTPIVDSSGDVSKNIHGNLVP